MNDDLPPTTFHTEQSLADIAVAQEASLHKRAKGGAMNDDLPPLPEPVAWMFKHRLGHVTFHTPSEYPLAYRDTCIEEVPLYTAPQAPQPAVRGEPAQAFYEDATAEPPYAQFARGVKEGYELGQRNARQDAANTAPQAPLTLTDERIDNLARHIWPEPRNSLSMLRLFARAALAAAQEKPSIAEDARHDAAERADFGPSWRTGEA